MAAQQQDRLLDLQCSDERLAACSHSSSFSLFYFDNDHLLALRPEEKADAAFGDIGSAADFGVGMGAAPVARGHDVVGQREPRIQIRNRGRADAQFESGFRIPLRILPFE